MGIPYLSERDPVEPLYFRDRYYSSCDSCGHKKANYLQRIYFDKKMENLENCACMCLDQRYKFKKGRDFVVMELPSFIPYVNQNLRVSSFVIAYLKIPKKIVASCGNLFDCYFPFKIFPLFSIMSSFNFIIINFLDKVNCK